MAQVAQDWESWSLQSPSFPWEPEAGVCIYPAGSDWRALLLAICPETLQLRLALSAHLSPGLFLLPEPGCMKVDEALPSRIGKGLANSPPSRYWIRGQFQKGTEWKPGVLQEQDTVIFGSWGRGIGKGTSSVHSLARSCLPAIQPPSLALPCGLGY